MSFFDLLKKRLAGNTTKPEVPDVGIQQEDRRSRYRASTKAGTRVLIVDDSPTVVAALRKLLRQNNLTTMEAFDAESALEMVKIDVPDLIFLDIVLPGMSGFDALRRLRREPATANVPIIMISGNEQATEQFYVQRIGANDFLRKPFSRVDVFSRVERLLNISSLELTDDMPDVVPADPPRPFVNPQKVE